MLGGEAQMLLIPFWRLARGHADFYMKDQGSLGVGIDRQRGTGLACVGVGERNQRIRPQSRLLLPIGSDLDVEPLLAIDPARQRSTWPRRPSDMARTDCAGGSA